MSLRLLGGFVAATVLCALLDVPLDRMLLMPLLVGVVLALCVSITIGVQEAISKLYGIALGLVAALVAFTGIKAQVKVLLGGIPPYVAVGGLLCAGLLIIAAKARDGRKESGRRLRPSLRLRAPTIVEAESTSENRLLTDLHESSSSDDDTDDLGLFRGRRNHGE